MNKLLFIAVTGAVFTIGLSFLSGAEAPSRADPTPPKTAEKATRQVFGDWVVACTPSVQGHTSCMMSQTLASEKLKKTVSVFVIGKDSGGKLKGSLQMPVGVSLPAGVMVGIDNSDPFSVPYSACHRIGCFAPFDLTEPLLGKMQKASKITAVIHSVSNQPLSLDFSGRGFPAAYEAYLKQSR